MSATSSPPLPDLSGLSISPGSRHIHAQQQRASDNTSPFSNHDLTNYDQSAQPRATYHFSTSPPINHTVSSHSYPNLGPAASPGGGALTASAIKNKPSRAGLPSAWLDQPTSETRSLSPHHTSDISSGGGSPPPPMSHMPQPYLAQQSLQPVSQQQQQQQSALSADDEIIPTAIVIKNIPFTVKRETLLDIIASLSIPTPYAFNYHLDGAGQFRGLAFANFRLPADADAVVAALNGFDVQGRKLRVEYKKVLQAGEKERIEREKAIRRMRSMQLEKERQSETRTEWDEYGQLLGQSQGMPIAMPASVTMPGVSLSPPGMPMASPARSYSGSLQTLGQQQQSAPAIPPLQIPQLPTYPQQVQSAMPQLPATQSLRSMGSSPPPGASSKAATELDLNDESTLEIYSRILVFKEDRMRDELAFSRTLTPKQRRVVHLVAQKLGVYHYSIGEGEERYAVVTRNPENRVGPTRHASQTFSRGPSSYLSPTSATSPSRPSPSSYGSLSGLRSKKSMPDLASLHTPPQRLQSRASNGNIREGYATIASPSRRNNNSFNNLFGNSSSNGNGNGSGIPPVPSLPSLPVLEAPSPGGVVRQPRGPGVGGFGRRVSEMRSPGGFDGLDTRTHEPLEI